MTNEKLTEEEAEQALDAVYPMSIMASHDGKIIQGLLQTMSEHVSGSKAYVDDYVGTGDFELIRNGDEIHVLRCLFIIDQNHVPKEIAAKLFPPDTNGGDKKP